MNFDIMKYCVSVLFLLRAHHMMVLLGDVFESVISILAYRMGVLGASAALAVLQERGQVWRARRQNDLHQDELAPQSQNL